MAKLAALSASRYTSLITRAQQNMNKWNVNHHGICIWENLMKLQICIIVYTTTEITTTIPFRYFRSDRQDVHSFLKARLPHTSKLKLDTQHTQHTNEKQIQTNIRTCANLGPPLICPWSLAEHAHPCTCTCLSLTSRACRGILS